VSAIDRGDVVLLLCDLVRIPSVNPRMGSGTGEQEIARFLTERLRGLGLTPSVVEVQPGRPNILATRPGRPGGRHLLFEAHTDTVSPAHDQADPFLPRLDGERLYGRGACDTKASLAAMCLAFESILAVPERAAQISLAFLMGEEIGLEGARHLAASGFRADGAVIGEPTGLDVVVAHKGVLCWRMTTVGKSADSANPELGRNAIGLMAHVVRALEERLIPGLARRSHPLLGSPTLSVGRIEGGLSANVVPDRCTIDVDRRFLPGETWAGIRAEVEAVLADLAPGVPDLAVTIEQPYLENGSLETPPEAAVVRLAQEAVQRIDGRHPLRGVPYGTDAGPLAAAGTPCVVLGPGQIAQAHTSTECVEIQQVVKAAAIYREMMLGA